MSGRLHQFWLWFRIKFHVIYSNVGLSVASWSRVSRSAFFRSANIMATGNDRIAIPVPAEEYEPEAEPAEEQAAPARGRGRPKGSTNCARMKTVKFDVANGVRAFTDLASNTHHPGWEWSGRSYPKMKRSNGPNIDSLNRHSPVLKILIWLAPNGYPDPYKLRDVWVQLHGLFKIWALGLRGRLTCRWAVSPYWHPTDGGSCASIASCL